MTATKENCCKLAILTICVSGWSPPPRNPPERSSQDSRGQVGTSTRLRRIPWPTASAHQVAADTIAKLASDAEARCAILFGREASGLTNEELQLCHVHLQIPAAPEYPSLNLAMAVQVVTYELFQAASEAPAEVRDGRSSHWDRPTATQAQLQALLDHLQQVLEDAGFLDPGNPGHRQHIAL